MSKIIWKKLCFPNFIKCLPTTEAPSDQPYNQLDPQNTPPPPSTANAATCPIMKNLNTRCDFNLINNSSSSPSTSKSLTTPSSADDYFYTSSDDSDTEQSPPNFATLLSSHRFFFSSPGSSNSITESPSTTTKSHKRMSSVAKGVRVPKYSSNPYLDFRRSMEEMLEANRNHRLVDDVDHINHNHRTTTSDDVECLHELLLCYLSLNPKHAHKDIISAFTDLVICLLSAPPPPSSPPQASDHHRHRN